MDIDIAYRPSQSLAQVSLAEGESIQAESGAMVGMSPNVRMETGSGGVMKGIQRLFGGESFFRNTFTAQGGPGQVLLAHTLCGDMVSLDATPDGYFLQSGAYVASTPNVEIDTKVGGFRTFFASEGLFVLKASAPTGGTVVVGAFGGIEELACDGELVIDTGHLVAWEASLAFSVGKSAEGWLPSFLSGEGLVCHFRGQGRIWIQSRNPSEYGQ
ncbi:MAG: TIGR00266 family protein, partial [Myxococcales bacterium]|nr:TIGR00266 family protein [Myxococcales bacterium]